MKAFYLVSFCIFLAACSHSSDREESDVANETLNTSLGMTTSSGYNTNESQNQNPIKFQYYRDKSSGMIQSRSPLPSNWLMHQESNAPYFITGPDGIKVNHTKTEQYAYSQDPYARQTIKMSGQDIAPVYSLQQIVEQHIRPSAQNQGYSFIKSYPAPGVQAYWEKFMAGMPQTGSQRTIYTLGTEWKNSQNQRSLILLVQSVIQKNQIINWTLQTTELEASSSQFQLAKEAYLYGICHTEINPQWQEYLNGRLIGQIRQNDDFWAQASAQSAQAHQQRMAAINARGTSNQSTAQIYSDISDISHAGYLNRSNMVSEGQSKTVNVIGNHAIIGNTETGERYQVESGNKFYWVNKDGEYFGTDDSFYDPRIDNRINGAQWMKFQIEN